MGSKFINFRGMCNYFINNLYICATTDVINSNLAHGEVYLILFYYCLLLRELFSYGVVCCGIVPEPTSRVLYPTRQHYRKIVLEGEDNDMFST